MKLVRLTGLTGGEALYSPDQVERMLAQGFTRTDEPTTEKEIDDPDDSEEDTLS